jgi:hypothetical protein
LSTGPNKEACFNFLRYILGKSENYCLKFMEICSDTKQYIKLLNLIPKDFRTEQMTTFIDCHQGCSSQEKPKSSDKKKKDSVAKTKTCASRMTK